MMTYDVREGDEITLRSGYIGVCVFPPRTTLAGNIMLGVNLVHPVDKGYMQVSWNAVTKVVRQGNIVYEPD